MSSRSAPDRRAFDDIMLESPFGFALTEGREHRLTYANPVFLRAVGVSKPALGVPLAKLLTSEAGASLHALCGRVLSEGRASEDPYIGRLEGGEYWSCSVWPVPAKGEKDAGVAVELIAAPHALRIVALQREVAGRLLMSALRESEAAEQAEAARERATILSDASGRLARSLDAETTRETVAGLSLPGLGSWCIVDLIEPGRGVTRLDMIHPDPARQPLLRELALHWSPRHGDPFGAPAVLADPRPVIISEDVEAALEVAAHLPENLELLRTLGVGAILTVPLAKGDRILGALTFVSARPNRRYSDQEIQLAMDLASRSADALESAKLYGEALSLRERAVAASEERIRLLGTISHELRTPLNAIGGFAQILDAEIHGPLTDRQREAIRRIAKNQEHLLVLVNNVLDFVRTGTMLDPKIVEISARQIVQRAVDLVDADGEVSVRIPPSTLDQDATLLGDPDTLHQILVNLLGNALKFTPPPGDVYVTWEPQGEALHIHVRDTGIGIPADKLEAIFDPFVRIHAATGEHGSAGLGLSISRDLARAMGGDLKVESTVGEGSCFTVVLPRVRGKAEG